MVSLANGGVWLPLHRVEEQKEEQADICLLFFLPCGACFEMRVLRFLFLQNYVFRITRAIVGQVQANFVVRVFAQR